MLVALAVASGSPQAEELSAADRAALQARKDALFQQMLREPGNLDATFAYADVAAKLGDNEGAVSALERMLLFNPNLPRVDLELGALYFRMGSYEIARTYFDKALRAKPPPEVKSRIETYLGQIGELSSAEHFSGYAFFGVQYQSDANIGPSAQIPTQVFGQPVVLTLAREFVKQADINVFGTGSVLYSYDLGTQNRDTLEISGVGFANHYSSVTRLDLGVVEATAGPRFNFRDPLPGVDTVSLKPYAIANDVSLGGNQYFHTIGIGGETNALTWHDLRIKSIFEFRDKNFNDAADRPLSRGLTGSDKLVSLLLFKPITAAPESELSFEFDFLDQDTRLPFFSNKTFAAAAAYRIHYDDPTGELSFPWETSIYLGRSWADYAAPDPCSCNDAHGLSDRFDRHWRFGITQSVQIGKHAAIVLQLQRDVVSSNLSLYRYTSNSILIGPQFRF